MSLIKLKIETINMQSYNWNTESDEKRFQDKAVFRFLLIKFLTISSFSIHTYHAICWNHVEHIEIEIYITH